MGRIIGTLRSETRMSAIVTLYVFVGYFSLLLAISAITNRRSLLSTENQAFYSGNRQSPWWSVAIGMVGASLSGVSFISVPGMIQGNAFTYMQTVGGFFVGYLVIAQILLPLYYRHNLTSIYTYLGDRFGRHSHRTGAWFFLLSRLIGSAVRLYIVVLLLQNLVFSHFDIPFALTASILVLLMWLYTAKSGIKTIVWTDFVQTLVLITVLVLIIVQILQAIDMPLSDIYAEAKQMGHTQLLVWDDWHSKQHVVKQFVSGIFIAIVMTGLDQDMMQKNLTCRTLSEAKKNMCSYGIAFLPINFLFLCLGVLLLCFARQEGIVLPSAGDQILPLLATQHLGPTVAVLFVIGIVAAAFSSADSALTSLTTSFTLDILATKVDDSPHAVRTRKRVHLGISVLFVIVMIIFQSLSNTSVLDAIYVIASYTYGPLLGMFALGLFTQRRVNDRVVPYIALASPMICYALNHISQTHWGYSFGSELLMLNGLLTFGGMWLIGRPNTPSCSPHRSS